ncbi:PQQ-binding-like beta-propeller repeat protein [bacterium]|nr:PQQ-binding-like beta-propeller repeat protein [bacterium]
MKRFLSHLTLALFSVPAFAASPGAFDWPQWQGPNHDAVSQETGLLQQWQKEGPPLAWKAEGLGGGDSAPSVAAGRVYAMANRGNDEIVFALSEADGKEVWVSRLGPAFQQRGWPQGKEGPGCTPTVDGDRLYAIGLGGDLTCLQVSDGKILWQRSFTKDFGGRIPTWSYRESPLIDDDKLICTPGGEGATMVALNKMTGDTIWKSEATGSPKAAYCSATAIDFKGERQYVNFTARSLIGVAAADGKFLWEYKRPANGHGINISTPVHQDGFIFAASAYGAGGGLMKLSKEADGHYIADEVYYTKKMQNHHGGMIVVDGALYGANGGNEGGHLVCLDFKSGDVFWDEADDKEHQVAKGSLAMADGRLYYRMEDGTVLLIEPNSKKYIEHGRFKQPDRSSKPAWSHPVIANGKLYIRDQDVLFCYNVKASGS